MEGRIALSPVGETTFTPTAQDTKLKRKSSALHCTGPHQTEEKWETSEIRAGGVISSPLLGDILLLKIFFHCMNSLMK